MTEYVTISGIRLVAEPGHVCVYAQIGEREIKIIQETEGNNFDHLVTASGIIADMTANKSEMPPLAPLPSSDVTWAVARREFWEAAFLRCNHSSHSRDRASYADDSVKLWETRFPMPSLEKRK